MPEDLQITVGGDISSLQASLDQIAPAAQAAGQSITQAFAPAGGALDEFDQHMAQAADALRAAAPAAQAAASGIAQVGDAARAAAPSLTQLAQGGGGAGGGGFVGAAQAADDMNTNLQQLGRGIQGAGLLFSALSIAVEQLGQNALETAASFERWQFSFSNMTGSLEGGAAMMQTVVVASENTGVEVGKVAESIRNLMAHGFDSTQAVGAFHAIADAAAFMGGGDGMIGKLTQAFDTLATRGEVSVGGLTRALNTLQSSGVQAWQMLADSAGVSVKQMVVDVKAGFVSAQDGMAVILQGMNQQFGGAAQKWSQSLAGVWNTFQTQTKVALDAIGEAIAPSAIKFLQAMTPILGAIADMANAFAQLPTPVKDAVFAIGAATVVFGPLLIAVGQAILVMGRLSAAFTITAEAAVPAAAAITATQTASAGAVGSTGLLATSVEALGGVAATAAIGLLAVSAAVGGFLGWQAGMAQIDALQSKIQGLSGAAAAMKVGNQAAADSIQVMVSALQKYNDQAVLIGKTPIEFPKFDPNASDAVNAYIKALQNAVQQIPNFNKSASDLTAASKDLGLGLGQAGQATVKFGTDVITLGQSANLAGAGIDRLSGMAAQAAEKQSELEVKVSSLKEQLQELKDTSDGSVSSIAQINRVTNELTAAQKAAYPEIKNTAKAIQDQTVYFSEGGKVLDQFAGIMAKVPQGAQAMQVALQQGFNFQPVISKLRDLETELTNMGAAEDKSSGGLSDWRDKVEATRQSLISFGLSLDPTKPQQFVQNGVNVVIAGLNTMGMSLAQIEQAVSKQLNIPLDEAKKRMQLWKQAVDDSVPSIGGLVKSVVQLSDGSGQSVTMLKPFVDQLNQVSSASKNAAQALTTMQQAQALMNSTWQIGADNAGKVALGVAQIQYAHDNAVNSLEVAKQVYEDINQKYLAGQVSVQDLEVAIKNYIATATAAIDPTGKLGGNIQALSAAAQKSGGALASAAADLGKASSQASSLGGSSGSASDKVSTLSDNLTKFGATGMSAMNGATMSAQQYLGVLNEMGASIAEITQAAAAMGYMFTIGYKSFIDLASQNVIQTAFGMPTFTQLPGGGIVVTPNSGTISNLPGGGTVLTGGTQSTASSAATALSSVATAATSAASALTTTTTAAQGQAQVWQSTYNEFIALGNSVAMATQQANDAVAAMQQQNVVYQTLSTAATAAATALGGVVTNTSSFASGLQATITAASGLTTAVSELTNMTTDQTKVWTDTFDKMISEGNDLATAIQAANDAVTGASKSVADFAGSMADSSSGAASALATVASSASSAASSLSTAADNIANINSGMGSLSLLPGAPQPGETISGSAAQAVMDEMLSAAGMPSVEQQIASIDTNAKPESGGTGIVGPDGSLPGTTITGAAAGTRMDQMLAAAGMPSLATETAGLTQLPPQTTSQVGPGGMAVGTTITGAAAGALMDQMLSAAGMPSLASEIAQAQAEDAAKSAATAAQLAYNSSIVEAKYELEGYTQAQADSSIAAYGLSGAMDMLAKAGVSASAAIAFATANIAAQAAATPAQISNDALQTSLTLGTQAFMNNLNTRTVPGQITLPTDIGAPGGTPIMFTISGNTFVGTPNQAVVNSLGDAIMTYMRNRLAQQSGLKV